MLFVCFLCRNDLELPTSGFMGQSPRAQGGQGPPPMLAERFQSVITQLFQQVQSVYSKLKSCRVLGTIFVKDVLRLL